MTKNIYNQIYFKFFLLFFIVCFYSYSAGAVMVLRRVANYESVNFSNGKALQSISSDTNNIELSLDKQSYQAPCKQMGNPRCLNWVLDATKLLGNISELAKYVSNPDLIEVKE